MRPLIFLPPTFYLRPQPVALIILTMSRAALLAIFASALTLNVYAGAARVIGIVTASGDFQLEQARVWGNSTLFEGATIETGAASSQIALRNGVKLQLASDSRARVFAGRLVLEKGAGQLTATMKYEIDVLGLRVLADPNARVAVKFSGARLIEVATLSGGAQVTGAHGLLASLRPGREASFAADDADQVTMSGCVLLKNGVLILADEGSGTVVELYGGDVAKQLGNRVQVTGSVSSRAPRVAGAREILNVTEAKLVAPGGCLGVATRLDASTSLQPSTSAPQTATHKGLSTGAKVGIVAAIAGGGAAAAGIAASAGKKATTSP